jgi:hypothetical protein
MMKKSALFALGIFSIAACADPAPSDSPGLVHASFAGKNVSLINDNGRCALSLSAAQSIALDMIWPCRFSEDRQKNVRVESYRQAQVLMVERSEHLPPPSKDCATDLQAIRYFKGRVEVALVSQIAACGPGYWDQKALIWDFDW